MQLLMVHGSGQNELTYHYQTAQFANADAVNLPGHPDGQPRDSIAGYVDWLRDYALANGYPPFVLFGHSMGGAIALDYALRFPQDLAGLVLIGTGARLRVHPDYLNRCLDDAQWRAEAPAYYEAINRQLAPQLAARALQSGPMVERNDLLACDRFDVMERVREIAIPSLVIVGADDVMTPVRYAEYLGRELPDAEVVVVPGSGHFVTLEQPAAVNTAIARFLERLPG